MTLVRSFQDAGLMAESLSRAGMRLSIAQMSSGRFEGNLLLAQIGGIFFLRGTFNQVVFIQGEKSTGRILFCFTLKTQGSNVLADGREITPDCLYGFDPEQNVHLVTPTNYQIGVVVVERAEFWQQAQQMGRDDLDERWLRRNWIQLRPAVLLNLLGYLHQIYYLVESQSDFWRRSPTPSLVKSGLLPLLVDAVSRPPSEIYGDLPSFQRVQLVKQAQQWMQDHLHQPIALKDLCNALSTSKRTLSYGFNDIFGMGSMTYLKIQRLNGVRHELLLADPKIQTVSGIAHRWGFWSLGHFSRDYKKMFGELPSETLLCHGLHRQNSTFARGTSDQMIRRNDD